jgi:hypothetical protein
MDPLTSARETVLLVALGTKITPATANKVWLVRELISLAFLRKWASAFLPKTGAKPKDKCKYARASELKLPRGG